MVLFPADKASVTKGEDSIAIIKTSDMLDRARCKASTPHGTADGPCSSSRRGIRPEGKAVFRFVWNLIRVGSESTCHEDEKALFHCNSGVQFFESLDIGILLLHVVGEVEAETERCDPGVECTLLVRREGRNTCPNFAYERGTIALPS